MIDFQENIGQFKTQEIGLAASTLYKAFYLEDKVDRHSIEIKKKALENFIQGINSLLANRLVKDETEKRFLLKLIDNLIIQKEAFAYRLMSEEERKNLKITARNFAKKTRDPIGLP